LTGKVNFSAWQGCHPQPRATYLLRSCRSCASDTNSSLEDDQNSLRSDRSALLYAIITRGQSLHDRLVAGTTTSAARDLAPIDSVSIADRSRKEKKRVGALVSPHSSLPIGFSTSSIRVNRNLPLCSPPSFSCPSRPSRPSLSRRCSLDQRYSGPVTPLGRAYQR